MPPSCFVVIRSAASCTAQKGNLSMGAGRGVCVGLVTTRLFSQRGPAGACVAVGAGSQRPCPALAPAHQAMEAANSCETAVPQVPPKDVLCYQQSCFSACLHFCRRTATNPVVIA